MITKPPIDDLTKIAGNKYVLCCSTSKRAKKLNEKLSKETVTTNAKAITIASEELASGKTVIVKED
ncbi:MAG: DNA-directed RNA polymerase subunit omega [Clostridia bacterium]